MEAWVPLFEIFLYSPCPEAEASLWLQRHFNLSSNTTPISTTSFISLLTRPSETTSVDESSPAQKRKDLCKLARIVLREDKGLDFWVKKAAQQLLDLVSESNYQWLSHLNLDSEEETIEEEFYSMPDWLMDAAKNSEPMLHWLPMPPDELSEKMPFTACGDSNDDDLSVDIEKNNKQEELDEVIRDVNVDENDPIDAEVEKIAKSLGFRLLNIESTSKASELATEIRGLCFENKINSLVILNLIEPWRLDDEAASVLISHLSSDENEADDELSWPAHVLCSIVLPKFLALNEPSSRVLMTATIEYCKAHQRAAEYALLFPLILKNEGINKAVCDVITRIVKECLHRAHVSAFCQKLLCEDRDARRFICLTGHRALFSEELVWTESLFCLWQNILNHNVHLTQDCVDRLVKRAREFSEKYSKSLKFGNFLLCLVNKCGPFLKAHKVLLTEAVEKTDSLVTRSILSKLSGL
ncbi:hypothetical protein PHJA_002045600 [Phtheirospermum japonicum]|uniref:Fanconi Anaemia group E protein C-terminal domain-containing protein n=1 Tax=Phtheirospermum japonicum TaxID=374723 RepID=A0A830CE40_9LAMI|nr:hypothetical protein PHJA_002045600 [Phtheirospermum japonicum]